MQTESDAEVSCIRLLWLWRTACAMHWSYLQ